jgi:hypothetical protein
VAEKLLPALLPAGSDDALIWFGVIIAMNLQTSFLTPPFGFALFYLRSVAAKSDYNDRITGAIAFIAFPAVTTAQIYKGSIAFIVAAADHGRHGTSERRKFLQNAGIAGILAAGAAPAVHAQAPAIRWRLASSFPKALDTIYGAAETFLQGVSATPPAASSQISVHAGGELMPPSAWSMACSRAPSRCAHTAPYYFFGKDETFAIDCAIPFGLNSRQMTAWMYEGNGMKLMREFYAGYNIVNFPMGNTGAQMGGWYRKEIKSWPTSRASRCASAASAARCCRAHRRRAAEHPRRRDLPGAGKGHHRRHRVGRPLRRREAGLRQGRQALLLPRLVGRRPAALDSTSTRRPTTRCRPSTRPSSSRPPRTPTSTCRPSTTPRTRPR